ncbi:hypothetical protein HN011_001653 [Eciton burchellii]|nr:hypothetical protein HN011_001653 [Eciton burchellii]
MSTSHSSFSSSSASEAPSLGLESASPWIRFVPSSTADRDPKDRTCGGNDSNDSHEGDNHSGGLRIQLISNIGPLALPGIGTITISGDASRGRNKKKTAERRCVYLDLQLDRNSAVILQSTMKRKSGKKENPLFVDNAKRTQNIAPRMTKNWGRG